MTKIIHYINIAHNASVMLWFVHTKWGWKQKWNQLQCTHKCTYQSDAKHQTKNWMHYSSSLCVDFIDTQWKSSKF